MRLRARLSLSIAGIAAVASIGLGCTVHHFTARAQLDQSRHIVDERLRTAVGTYTGSGALAFGVTVDDPRLPRRVAGAAADGHRVTYLQETPDGPVLWAATSSARRVLSVRTSYAQERASIRRLDRTLLLSGGATVLVTSVLGVFVAAGLSRRIRSAARTARRVADGDLDARSDASRRCGAPDEVTELAGALDEMSHTLQRRIEAEQRVTADIAHELRTPVAGLVTATELLPEDRAAELVRDRVLTLRKLTEDLLEIARLDTAVEVADLETIDAGEVVRRCATQFAEDVRVRIGDASEVRTDPRRLERVVTNLITNSTVHGSAPIEIAVRGSVVRVRDHGPGFPAELIDHGPSRFRTGRPERGHGHGLGLTIAVAQTRLLGAALEFDNATDGGALATLTLPTPTEPGTGSAHSPVSPSTSSRTTSS